MKTKLYRLLSIVLAMAMLVSLGVSHADDAGKYYPSFTNMTDAKAAAIALTTELAAEGDVLLKNDGALPLKRGAWISVFGVTSDSLTGASDSAGAWSGSSEGGDTLAAALESAGYKVNPTLKQIYANDSSRIGSEITDFSGTVESSLRTYKEAAFIVLSREGGEGGDASTVTAANGNVELAVPGEHLALAVNAEGQEIKHSMMLTDSEITMIDYVKAHFGKVIVILNTSNAMEVGALQNDDGISAIIDIGRPGVGGLAALAQIIDGTVNPSGAMIDEWMTDQTTDPTWYNFGSNKQNNREGYAGSNTYMGSESGTSTQYDSQGYHGVDYEEGIYLGYKYYETRYFDMYNNAATDEEREAAQQWWAANVTYPFGYGLSYTTFTVTAGGIFTDAALTQALPETVDAASFSSSAETGAAAVEKLYMPVTVKNTGDMAGKKIVQVYVTAPYTAGGIEKSAVTLVGYSKTDLIQPGASETVVVAFNVQDLASWDTEDANGDGFHGDYELDAGEYVVRVMESSHFDCATDIADPDDAYDQVVFTLGGNAHMKLDDFSHNEVGNLFSAENGSYDGNTKNGDVCYNNVRTADMMGDDASGMTILSRADFEGTFPKAPTAADLTFKENVLANFCYWDNYTVSNKSVGPDTCPIEETESFFIDESGYPWYKTAEDIPASWTQAAGVYDDNHQMRANGPGGGISAFRFPMYVSLPENCPIKFADMTGVSYDDPKWDEFLNQLTWDELCSVIEFGGYSTAPLDSVDKIRSADADGPNNLSSSHCWCSEGVIASTWNVELANRQGALMGDIALLKNIHGWYGPGMDVHRSPFSGRNNEYYSQDGIQGGYIAAAVVQGAESKGVICYIKHAFMNDQETDRGNLFTWAPEQAMRENYAKMFQMAFQEGDSSAAMVGYGRMAGFSNTNNYNLATALYQKEWGVSAYLVTDGYIGWINLTDVDMLVRGGSQIVLYNTPFCEYLSGIWDAEANCVRLGAGDKSELSPTQWYCVRKAAKDVLFQTANSCVAENGYTGLVIEERRSEATQGVKFEGTVSIDDLLTAGSSASYSLEGELPEGLSFSESTGMITGTPKTAGEYTVGVNFVIDGCIRKASTYALNVAGAFRMNEYSDDLEKAAVGKDFIARVESDIFNTADGKYATVTYTLKDGEMPAGLTLEADGTISGKPEAAGVYSFVVSMTAEEAAMPGPFGPPPGAGASKVELDYPMTITVSE